MAFNLLETTLLSLVLYFGLLYFQLYRKRARSIQFASSEKCGELPILQNKLPGGLDHLLQLLSAKTDVLDDFLGVHFRTLGPSYTIHSLIGRVVITSDPENVRTVLSARFRDFSKGKARRNTISGLLGNGLFSTDGSEWSRFRSLIRPQFARDQLLEAQAEESHLQHLLGVMEYDSEGQWTGEVDLTVLFQRFTLDTSIELLFGIRVNSQSIPDNSKLRIETSAPTDPGNIDIGGAEFLEATDAGEQLLGWGFRLGPLSWVVKYHPRFKKSKRTIHDFAAHCTELALSSIGEIEGEKPKFRPIKELTNNALNRRELHGLVLHALFAGRDTTAILLSWIFILLLQHPSVMSKLREEIDRNLGHTSTAVDFTSLKDCNYLRGVIMETLRVSCRSFEPPGCGQGYGFAYWRRDPWNKANCHRRRPNCGIFSLRDAPTQGYLGIG